jgi:hypothetical protein
VTLTVVAMMARIVIEIESETGTVDGSGRATGVETVMRDIWAIEAVPRAVTRADTGAPVATVTVVDATVIETLLIGMMLTIVQVPVTTAAVVPAVIVPGPAHLAAIHAAMDMIVMAIAAIEVVVIVMTTVGMTVGTGAVAGMLTLAPQNRTHRRLMN